MTPESKSVLLLPLFAWAFPVLVLLQDPKPTPSPAPSASQSVSEVVRRVGPAVATLLALDEKGKTISQASGFFLAPDKLATARHAMIGASGGRVRLADGHEVPVAGVLGESRDHDLLVLSVPEHAGNGTAAFLSLAKEPARQGDRILVIGSPFGLEHTVSDGLVSSFQELPGLGTMLQLSAPVSPGSSGGPVLNLRGEVVGIVSGQRRTGQNLNFAVPVARLRSVKLGTATPVPAWSKAARSAEPKPEAEAEYWKGADALKRRDARTALSHFVAARRIDPGFAHAWHMESVLLMGTGRNAEALKAGREAVRLDPDRPLYLTNLGIALGFAGKPKEQLAAYQKALRLDLDFGPALFNLGLFYERRGQFPQAETLYRHAIHVNPGDFIALGALGLLIGKEGRIPEAIQALEASVQLNPSVANHWNNLGTLYAGTGAHEPAIAAYKKALALQPDDEDSWINLSGSLRALQHFDEEREALKRAIRLKPDDPQAHYRMGLNLVRKEDRPAALDEYRILQKLDAALAARLFQAIYP